MSEEELVEFKARARSVRAVWMLYQSHPWTSDHGAFGVVIVHSERYILSFHRANVHDCNFPLRAAQEEQLRCRSVQLR